MNREFLTELGLEKETIDKIMSEHGKTVNDLKTTVEDLKPTKDELDTLKQENKSLEVQLSDLQGSLESQKSELGNVEDLKKQIEGYKLNELKTTIARQANIPFELAGRLSGTTEEEIKADAENLAELVNTKQTLPLRTTEPPKVDVEEKAYKDLVDNLT